MALYLIYQNSQVPQEVLDELEDDGIKLIKYYDVKPDLVNVPDSV